MSVISQTTTDHQEIQQWVEEHHGKPQIIDDPTAESDDIGIRIDFPGKKDDTFFAQDRLPKDISWEEFFHLFEQQQLTFHYDNEIYRTDPSSAYRFEKRG